MRRVRVSLVVLLLATLACGTGETATSTPVSTALPPGTVGAPAGSERRCGDGVCDGPEDESICPQDCSHQQVPQGDVPPAEEGVYRVTNPTSNARLLVQVIRPQAWDGEALPALLLIPGGTDPGSRFAESPANTAQVIADEGFAVVLFDADGRGYSEGEEEQNGYVHQDGLAAVVEFAAALPEIDEGRFGVASWSFGVTMAAGALARYPDLPLRFLIDWEGPANRDDTGGCGEDHVGHLQGHPCDDEEFWREREASIFALGLQVPYLRLQSERDHAQPDNDHALLMIANATAERYGGHGRAPWTRLNDLRPNTVYGVEAPPPMIPEGTASMEDLVVGYAWELFALEE